MIPPKTHRKEEQEDELQEVHNLLQLHAKENPPEITDGVIIITPAGLQQVFRHSNELGPVQVPRDVVNNEDKEEIGIPSIMELLSVVTTPLVSRNKIVHKEPLKNEIAITIQSTKPPILTNWKNPLRFQKMKDFHNVTLENGKKNS